MKITPKNIAIADYSYSLPEDRVAQFPLPVRSDSKLLLFKSQVISNHIFGELPSLLSANDVLFMNKTRVIPARLRFRKSTGAEIEIFCLEPIGLDHQQAMASQGSCTWKCLVGGAKKWKGQERTVCQVDHPTGQILIEAELLDRLDDAFSIRFSWKPESISFSAVLHEAGKIPLPPYFHRDPDEKDLDRYQTVFAENEGSVAAPTAGLHFTDEMLQSLTVKQIGLETLTLHVGAGTFKPVSSDLIGDHYMHGEVFSISTTTIKRLIQHIDSKRIIAVGTTSMRALESLYWLGLKISSGHMDLLSIPTLNQWECYEMVDTLSTAQGLEQLLFWCEKNGLQEFTASTSIMIAPGFKFRICRGLITNFHMPQSTLLVLVSAFIGQNWKQVYEYALSNQYRFLSYGDGSLLFAD